MERKCVVRLNHPRSMLRLTSNALYIDSLCRHQAHGPFYLLCHFQCPSVQGKSCIQDSECACVNPDNTTLYCNFNRQCAQLTPFDVAMRRIQSNLPVSGIRSSCIIHRPNERNSYLLPFTQVLAVLLRNDYFSVGTSSWVKLLIVWFF